MKRVFALILSLCVLASLTACKDKAEEKPLPDTFAEIIQAYGKMADVPVKTEEKLKFSKKIDGESWNMQGGDSDGTYGYFAMNDGEAAGQSLTRIYKINLTTWEIVKISHDLSLGHANDVTYMPDDHQLIVTACEGLTAKIGYIVDADTLELLGEKEFPRKHANMCYNPERQQYVLGFWGNPKELTIYDKDLNKVSSISCLSGDAHQGLECDEKYIYYLMSPSAKGRDEGYLYVYTWEGEFVQYIKFDMPYESENIAIIGNKAIIAVNDHHEEKTVRFYELTIPMPQ